MASGTRERLRSFIERVRLAVFLKRTRAARVVFALVVTLLLTATATSASYALGLFELDDFHLDDHSHLHMHGSADESGGGEDGGDDGSVAGAGAGGGGGGGGGGGVVSPVVVKKRAVRSPMFLGKSHQAMLFAARVHGVDDSTESEEAREAAELGDAAEEGEGEEGAADAGAAAGDGGGGAGGGGGEGEAAGVNDAAAGESAGDRGGGGEAPSAPSKGCRAPMIRRIMHTALRGVSEWRDAFGADVVARYNWERCAVVGNSGALLASRHGDVIDSHTAVFRLNAAPTSARLAQRVGKKTHLRLLNNAKAKAYLMNGCSRNLPCDPGSTLVAVRGTPFPLATKMWVSAHASVLAGHVPSGEVVKVRAELEARMNATGTMQPLGKVKAGQEIGVAVPPRNVLGAMKVMREKYRDAYAERCGKDEVNKFFKGPVTPSSGMFAIIIALSLCNSTSVFGFGTGARGGYQYFHSRNVQSSAHSFDTEKRIIGVMGKSGVVRVNGVVDQVEEDKWKAMLGVDKEKLGEMTADD